MITKHYRIKIDLQTPIRLLDGARVRVDKNEGILYQHGLVKDNFAILELDNQPFFGLMKHRKFQMTIESEDEGLFTFPEIVFIKERKEESFADRKSKTIQFEVPDYDDFKVRVRVRGAGKTRIIAVTADLIED
ncbi:hypothetical protein OfM1_21000 [Lactovum odontotermitis]